MLEILADVIEQSMKNVHTKVTTLCENLRLCISNNQEASDIYKPIKVIQTFFLLFSCEIYLFFILLFLFLHLFASYLIFIEFYFGNISKVKLYY